MTPKAAPTKLAREIQAATLLADSKGDYAAVASRIDAALAESAASIDRVQALIFRAGLASTIGDLQLAHALLSDVRQIPVDDHERMCLPMHSSKQQILSICFRSADGFNIKYFTQRRKGAKFPALATLDLA